MKQHLNNLPQWLLGVFLVFTISSIGATEPRAPRPDESYGIETLPIPEDAGTDVCCPLPRDVYVEGDLTVGGTLTIVGPIIFPPLFNADIILQPVSPDTDICLIWLESAVDGGAEKARLCDSTVVGQKGLSISIDGGVTKNFQVDNSGNTDITGNFDLVNSTATTGNITKAGIPFITNYGTDNTFVGVDAGNVTLTGVQDTAIGVSSLQSLTTANNNTSVGFGALTANTSGGENTAVGVNAGFLITTGSNNTIVGYGTGSALTSGDTNNILIGYGVGVVGDNNTTRIGSTAAPITRCFVSGIDTASLGATANIIGINPSAQVGTVATTFDLSGNEHVTGTSQLDGNVGIGQVPGADKLDVTGNFVLTGNQTTTGYSQINTGGALGLYAGGTQITSPLGYITAAYFNTTRIIHAHINGAGTILSQSGGLSCTRLGVGSYRLNYDAFISIPTVLATSYSTGTTVAIVDSSTAISTTEARIKILTLLGVPSDDEFMVVIMGQAA